MKKIGFKYEIVANELEAMIQRGGFSIGKLPSEPEFMDKYKVGKITVYKALTLLADKGIVTRVKGSGTFIKGCEPGANASRTQSRNVLVVMNTTGHVYSELFASLRAELSHNDFITLSTDFDLARCDFRQKTRLFSTINSGLYGVLIYGDAYWKNPIMRGRDDIPAVFIGHYDHDGVPPKGLGVFFDYEAGAFLATKHLLEAGRRDIVFLRHEWRHSIEITDSHRENHPIRRMEAGFEKALREYGDAKGRICSISDDKAGFEFLIRGLLAPGGDRPDGVLCMVDCMAKNIMETAEGMNVSIPEDLAVVGYYDTPWANESRIPITSVSVGLEEAAAAAAAMLAHPENFSEPIKVQPKLVIRESTTGERRSNLSIDPTSLERVV